MCICKNIEVVTTSGNLSAISDFWHISTSHEIKHASNRKLDPEKIVVGVGILMICVIVLEIFLLPVTWLPSWISSTRQRPTKPEVPPLESLTPQT